MAGKQVFFRHASEDWTKTSLPPSESDPPGSFSREIRNSPVGFSTAARILPSRRRLLPETVRKAVEFYTLICASFNGRPDDQAKKWFSGLLYYVFQRIGVSDARHYHPESAAGGVGENTFEGPAVLETHGLSTAQLHPESSLSPDDEFFMMYDCFDAYESDAWLRAGLKTKAPVCAINAGYASGWCEYFFERPLAVMEIACRARGDSTCRFIVSPRSRISRHAARLGFCPQPLETWPQTFIVPEIFTPGLLQEALLETRNELENRLSSRTIALQLENDRLTEKLNEHKQEELQNHQLQTLLYQAQKMEAVGTLAGGVAHNFNNLLMGIQGNISLMMMTTEPSSPNFKRLKSIEEQVASGEKLTSQVLGYARREKFELKAVDLNQLAQKTIEIIARTQKEISVTCEFSEGLPTVKADSGQIEQVLLNIFVNAVEAMPGGGELKIKTSVTPFKEPEGGARQPGPREWVLLKITDTGMGMDQEVLKKVFDPFFTTKEPGKGTGLGLASAYGIIKEHSGLIEVESEKGRGTTFGIYLPPSGMAVARPPERAPRIVKGSGTILLVDDEPIVLEVGRDILESLNYKVLSAGCGNEAIEHYKNHMSDISLVLLDMTMPGLNGSQTFKALTDISPDVKVILTSGYNITAQIEETLKMGCKGFIKKPFGINDLSQLLSQTLNKV